MKLFNDWLLNVNKSVTKEGLAELELDLDMYLDIREKLSLEYYNNCCRTIDVGHNIQEAKEFIASDRRFTVPLEQALVITRNTHDLFELRVHPDGDAHSPFWDTFGETPEECVIRLAHLLKTYPNKG